MTADRRTAESLLRRRGVTAAVVVSVAAVGLALLWPAAAETVLRLLLVVLAAGAVAWLLTRAGWPPASQLATSPFRTTGDDDTDRHVPLGLRNLAGDLSADVRAATGGAIPYSVRSPVRDELCRRLADDHGLDPRVPAHAGRIQALVSPPTWALVQPPPPGARRGLDVPIHLRHLGTILDDLERL
ncbi:MAG TPA: hypothetical protein VGN37_16740 [Actinocatenispora sp.]